jgi:hypothetical protein
MNLIPRENGKNRLYIQLDDVAAGSRFDRKNLTIEEVQARARKILHPYELEWESVEWFTCYQIGQRLATACDAEDYRVFIAGDATHTHSPKAGQGMNLSVADTYNLTWKIALVERGFAKKKELLGTYATERRKVAKDMIDFDRNYSSKFSKYEKLAGVENSDGANGVTPKYGNDTFENNEKLEAWVGAFAESLYLLSGYGQVYPPSVVTLPSRLSMGLKTGELVLPAQVTRLANADVIELHLSVPLNGAFRIYILSGPLDADRLSLLDVIATELSSASSFLQLYHGDKSHPANAYDRLHCPLNPIFNLSLILKGDVSRTIEFSDLPSLFWKESKYHVYVDDVPEYKRYRDLNTGVAHHKWGLENGGIVVGRPDGYVGMVAELNEKGLRDVNRYFQGFLESN